jgi:hypothetical protein
MLILESFQSGRGLLLEGLNIVNGVVTKNNIIAPVERVKLYESAANPDDRYKFMGIFLVGDAKNANGRIYPFREVMKPECDRYIREAISQNFGGGEFEHPSNLTLNGERFTHKITKFYYDGCNVIGEAVAGERGMGHILRDFIDLGFRFGMSSRGIGTVNEGYVQDDFELHFVDAVMAPSAPGAYMKYGSYLRDVSESALYEKVGLSEENIETVKRNIKATSMTGNDSQAKIVGQWNDFMRMLKNK